MLRGIEVKEPNSFFSDLAKIDLFYNNSYSDIDERQKNLRYSVIYGKNGSGKTSISKAFYSALNDKSSYEVLKFYDNESKEIIIDKENTYVFNEQFIENNVKISSDDSVNAIVLFGKSLELDEEIKKNEKIIEDEKDKIAKRNIGKFDEKNNPSSLNENKNSIIDQLKNTWAVREQEIKDLRKKGSVTDDVLSAFLNMNKPKKSQKELKAEYDSILAKLNTTRDKKEKLPEINIDFEVKEIAFYNEMLAESFNKKTTTELSLKIFNLLKSNSSKYIDDSLDVLKNMTVCPLCYQEIPNQHKNDVLKVLDELFDKTIEEKKSAILNERISKIQSPDFSSYRGKINDSLIESYLKIIDKVNEAIENINIFLEQKASSIYQPHEIISIDIDTLKTKYKEELRKLNESIINYNDDVSNFTINTKKAMEINKELAYFDIEALVSSYKKYQSEYDEAMVEDNKSKEIIADAEDEIRKLQSQKNNFSIALDEINDALSFIFGTRKRLSLSITEDGYKYYIYTNGRKTKFSRLSTGEKNIIGLVYFYEFLKKNCQQGQYFCNQSIYILDDPISSFDYENKIGILSFIKKMIKEISKGNEDNQILILTHELEVANFINKIFGDLNISKKSCSRELVNKKTLMLNPTKYTTYGKLLLEVYDYIVDETSRNTISIGNVIRRLVEAYSYFNYNEAMNNFLSKDDTFKKINDSDLRNYFTDRMNKLLMNETSHSQNVIRQAPDTFNFDLFSDEDILKTAKDIICLLYSIDCAHVDSYLSSVDNYKDNIKKWISEIKK